MEENLMSNFSSYLHSTQETINTIDLSNSTLLEIISFAIDVRSKVYPNYKKQLNSLIHNLSLLQSEFNCILYSHQITDIFWYNFIEYLTYKNISQSSIRTMYSQLKSILNWASRYHAIISPTFNFLKIPSVKSFQIALTQDDVSRLYHFNIDSIPRRAQYKRHLKAVRDMFVLSCSLGQRFSDMIRVDKSCFDRNIFSILQQKTNTKSVVDIDRYSMDRTTVYQILEKYDYKSPITTDISCYDKYIKELCKYAGFIEEIKVEKKIKGKIESVMIPKYKLIGSHTARRTFITVNVLRNYPLHEIMRASGHKTYDAFQKYLCRNNN